MLQNLTQYWLISVQKKDFFQNQNADVHIKSADGFSPLHRAAFGGHLEAVRILVKVSMFVLVVFSDVYAPRPGGRAGGIKPTMGWFERFFFKGSV